MNRNRILVPRGTITSDEIEMIASKLFTIGYTVKKGSVTAGMNKGSKYIEFWIDGGDNRDGTRNDGSGQRRLVRDDYNCPDSGKAPLNPDHGKENPKCGTANG